MSPNNLNLDEMFSFLQEERGLDNRGGGGNKTLDEITSELNELNDLLTQDMVCSVKTIVALCQCCCQVIVK